MPRISSVSQRDSGYKLAQLDESDEHHLKFPYI